MRPDRSQNRPAEAQPASRSRAFVDALFGGPGQTKRSLLAVGPKSRVSADLHRASVRDRQHQAAQGHRPLAEPGSGGRYLLGTVLVIVAAASGLIALIVWLI